MHMDCGRADGATQLHLAANFSYRAACEYFWPLPASSLSACTKYNDEDAEE